jgi:acyl-CoA thioesterase
MLARDRFSAWLGLELVAVEAGACTCRMTVREEMVNGFGVSHGGVVFSLADSAFAFACNSSGFITVSIENSIRYPAAIHPGDVLTATVKQREAAAGSGISWAKSPIRTTRSSGCLPAPHIEPRNRTSDDGNKP